MEAIKIPAIRGKIGNTIYYSANLSFQQVNDMVKRVDSELHTSNSLKEVIQRSLTDNYIKIKDYIVKREDHFFDSMVLAVYDGDPQWTEIRYELNEESFNNVGLLEFSGEEKCDRIPGLQCVETHPEDHDDTCSDRTFRVRKSDAEGLCVPGTRWDRRPGILCEA